MWARTTDTAANTSESVGMGLGSMDFRFRIGCFNTYSSKNLIIIWDCLKWRHLDFRIKKLRNWQLILFFFGGGRPASSSCCKLFSRLLSANSFKLESWTFSVTLWFKNYVIFPLDVSHLPRVGMHFANTDPDFPFFLSMLHCFWHNYQSMINFGHG